MQCPEHDLNRLRQPKPPLYSARARWHLQNLGIIHKPQISDKFFSYWEFFYEALEILRNYYETALSIHGQSRSAPEGSHEPTDAIRGHTAGVARRRATADDLWQSGTLTASVTILTE